MRLDLAAALVLWSIAAGTHDARGEPNWTTGRLATTLTFLDHIDRPRLVVTFGAGALTLPDTLNPTTLGSGNDLPEATAFYNTGVLGIRPTSIVEMIYGPDGGVTQRRTYDMAWDGGTPSSPPYHAEFHFTGHSGQEVFTQTPGSGVQITRLDGQGRTASVKTVIPGVSAGDDKYAYQVARTDYVYDRDGNGIDTTRWERVKPEGDELDDGNAVRQRSVSWFDKRKRLVAAAELGSEQAGGLLRRPSSGFDPFQRVDPDPSPPTVLDIQQQLSLSRGALAGPQYADVPLWRYGFDRAGRQTHVLSPRDSLTRSVFTGTGRLHSRTENALDSDPGLRRLTEYGYSIGRLTEITAYAAAQKQRTMVDYGTPGVMEGAAVVDHEFSSAESRHNGVVARMRLPHPTEPDAVSSQDADYRLRYNFALQVAERIDARGVSFRYRYDDLSRLVSIEVGHYQDPATASLTGFVPGYPSSMTPPGASAPAERVGYISYEYDAAGRLTDIIAFASRAESEAAAGPYGRAVISHDRYVYDARGNLLAEHQSHAGGGGGGGGREIVEDPRDFNGDGSRDPDDLGDFITCFFLHVQYPGLCPLADFNNDGFVDTDDLADFQTAFFGPWPEFPYVSYAWDWQPTHADLVSNPAQIGYNRLSAVSYPEHQDGAGNDVAMGRRVVAIGYGAPGSADDVLCRVRSMDNTPGSVGYAGGGGAAASNIARFEYAGTSRRVGMWLGVVHVPQSGGVDAHDVAAVAQSTITRDGSQNITGLGGLDTYGRLADLHYMNSAGDTLYRAQYRYDSSGNRVSAHVTQATAGGTTWLDNLRSHLNMYDGLDRLTGTTIGTLNMDGSDVIVPEVIATSTMRRMDVWQMDVLGNWIGGAAAGTTGPPSVDLPSGAPAPTHNAGRWTWETASSGGGGTGAARRLTHETDNRNELSLIATQEGSQGADIAAPRYDAAGNLTFDGVYFYEYDAWNRTVRVSFVTAILPGEPEDTLILSAPIKEHVYDGLGRLIRTVSPYPNPDDAVEGAQRVEQFYYDGIRRIQEITATTDGSSAPITALAREYVWGPGDGPAGVDELLAQFEGAPASETDPEEIAAIQDKPWFVLQDAGGDIVAVVERLPGTIGGSGSNANDPLPASVVAQWTYDAYGAVLTTEHFHSHPPIHCGHKGLFLDRLDAGMADTGGNEIARLVPDAEVVYRVRNRDYSPRHGRWNQRDPNKTGTVLIATLPNQGRCFSATVDAFDLIGNFTDGAGLYQYVGSNPCIHADPHGLLLGLAIGVAGALLPGPHDFARGALKGLVENYATNQDWDVEWALDWDLPDDAHSRTDNSWIGFAMAYGIRESFHFGVPLTNAGFNPLDLFASANVANAGSFYQTTVRVLGRAAKFSSRLHLIHPLTGIGHYVLAFRHPNYKFPFIKFPSEAIKKTVNIALSPGKPLEDIRNVNRSFGKPPDYDWIREFGEAHTWHHDYNVGRMQLVPSWLHKATYNHTGGAKLSEP